MGWDLTYNTGKGNTTTTASVITPLSAETQRNIFLRLSVFAVVLISVVIFLVVRNRRRNARDDQFFNKPDEWR